MLYAQYTMAKYIQDPSDAACKCTAQQLEETKDLLAISIPLFILSYLFCLIKTAILLSHWLSLSLSY